MPIVPTTLTSIVLYGETNLSRKGRGTVYNLLQSRNYSTGGATQTSNVEDKLNNLRMRARVSTKIDRNLITLLSNPNLLELAYHNIKSKPGNMTPGVNPETLDGINAECFIETAHLIKTGKFYFQPSRRIQIPKASSGTRPLSIGSPRDKIVQEAMRMILEAIYEPTFSENSHGFRPSRSCHTALKSFYDKFKNAQ